MEYVVKKTITLSTQSLDEAKQFSEGKRKVRQHWTKEDKHNIKGLLKQNPYSFFTLDEIINKLDIEILDKSGRDGFKESVEDWIIYAEKEGYLMRKIIDTDRSLKDSYKIKYFGFGYAPDCNKAFLDFEIVVIFDPGCRYKEECKDGFCPRDVYKVKRKNEELTSKVSKEAPRDALRYTFAACLANDAIVGLMYYFRWKYRSISRGSTDEYLKQGLSLLNIVEDGYVALKEPILEGETIESRNIVQLLQQEKDLKILNKDVRNRYKNILSDMRTGRPFKEDIVRELIEGFNEVADISTQNALSLLEVHNSNSK